PETKWRVAIHSQHFACDRCCRSFEPLTPHNFSFNSSLGWCTACEGLGTQTGANLSELLHDPKLTLRGGAVAMFRQAGNQLFDCSLASLSRGLGVPIDTPFDRLSPRQPRSVLYGGGEEWFEVRQATKGKKDGNVLCRFQYKGLYPALEDAAKLLP